MSILSGIGSLLLIDFGLVALVKTASFLATLLALESLALFDFFFRAPHAFDLSRKPLDVS